MFVIGILLDRDTIPHFSKSAILALYIDARHHYILLSIPKDIYGLSHNSGFMKLITLWFFPATNGWFISWARGSDLQTHLHIRTAWRYFKNSKVQTVPQTNHITDSGGQNTDIGSFWSFSGESNVQTSSESPGHQQLYENPLTQHPSGNKPT